MGQWWVLQLISLGGHLISMQTLRTNLWYQLLPAHIRGRKRGRPTGGCAARDDAPAASPERPAEAAVGGPAEGLQARTQFIKVCYEDRKDHHSLQDSWSNPPESAGQLGAGQ